MKLPHASTVVVGILIAFAAIWISNNVNAVGKIVGPKVKTS